MRKLSILPVAILSAVALACGGEDSIGPIVDEEPIVGVWFSGGENVAPGLRVEPFNVDSIRADFRANGTYEVLQYTPAVTFTLTGTWQVGPGAPGTIRSIVVTQTSPVAVVASGIFRVANNTMTYEVIQTEPALAGVGAPTVSGGFGSTTILNNPTNLYVQTYVRRQ
jgi:hypothetical protein